MKLTFHVQTIKKGIEGIPVAWYQEVFDIVFKDLDRKKANTCVICEWKKTHDSKDKDKDSGYESSGGTNDKERDD